MVAVAFCDFMMFGMSRINISAILNLMLIVKDFNLTDNFNKNKTEEGKGFPLFG